jgi:cell division transport system permease protein
LGEALRSIRANVAVSIAATVTVLITVFILGAFIPSFLKVQSAVDAQKKKLDINVFVSDSATVAQKEGLANELSALQRRGLVREFEFFTKDQNLAELRERLRDPDILEQLPANPIPAKFNVQPVNPEDNARIAAEIEGHPALDADLGVIFEKSTTDRLLEIARYIQWAGLGLISILLVASVLLIGNTIRLSLFARRREVEVMKLVGATNWFIRWPFVIEGVICGIAGAVASVALLWVLKVAVVDNLFDSVDNTLTRTESATIGFVWLSVILISAGALVGALGSGITLRRFLKV